MSSIVSLDNFIGWFAALAKVNAAKIINKDIVLDDFGSRRFALGIVTSGKNVGSPVLGIYYKDVDAVMNIPWQTSGIICGHQGRDWIALSCKDIRVSNSAEMMALPLRIWIPFPIGSLDEWVSKPPKRLEIRKSKNGKGNHPIIDNSPLAVLPLTIKNKWEDFN